MSLRRVVAALLVRLPRAFPHGIVAGSGPFWEMTMATTTSTMNQYSNGKTKMTSPPPGMPRLPDNVVQYSQVPKQRGTYFQAPNGIPKGLLKDHNTRKGTWGIIRMHQGILEYTIQEPQFQIFHLTPDTFPGVIEPQMKHRVRPLGDDVQFAVEFYRIPGTGPVQEQREGM